MTPGVILAASRNMLVVALLLAAPFLVAAILASLIVGLLQATTRMNDLTLSFVPRFLAVLAVMYLTAPWVGGQLAHYLERAALALREVTG
jgi:flagellar biosynthetic protein FliQ